MKYNKLPFRVTVLLIVSLLLTSGSPAITAMADAGGLFVFRAAPRNGSPAVTSPSDASPSDGIFDEDLLINDLVPVATAPQADIPIVRIDAPFGSELFLLSQGSDVQTFLDADPALSLAIAYTGEGRVRQPVPVVYDTEGFDSTASGLTFLEGIAMPHAGYSIDEEIAAVRLPFFLYHAEYPAELPVSGFAHSLTPPLTVYTTDSPTEEILQDIKRQTTLTYRVGDAYNCTVPISWDAREVRAGTPGTYPLYAVPDLPDGLVLPDRYSVCATFVTVQQPGVLALAPPVLYHSNLVTMWQEDMTPDEDLLTLWYAVEDGPWTADDNHTYMIGSLSRGMLYFNRSALVPETKYYFQLEYDGMLSNILRIVPEEGEFRCSDVGGDRDAVDRTPQKPPEVIQPPPVETLPDKTPPDDETPALGGAQSDDHSQSDGELQADSDSQSDGNSQSGGGSLSDGGSRAGSILQSERGPQSGDRAWSGSISQSGRGSRSSDGARAGSHTRSGGEPQPAPDNSAPVMEQDTEDSAVWSRTRLLAYLRLNPGKPVVFEKHGIRLSLPADAAKNLADSGDFLSAVIKKPDSSTISIELLLDGEPLREFPSVTVTLSYAFSGSGGGLSITAPDGTEVKPLFLDSATMTVSFSAIGGGIYIIEDTALPPSPQLPGAMPEAILITGLLLCLAVLAYRIVRRQHSGLRQREDKP